MFFADIHTLDRAGFKRLTGVERTTFDQMVSLVQQAHRAFGRPSKLCIEDQILVTLMYWREYRTMFHIAHSYKVSEPTVWRIIRRTETILSEDETFTLPQRVPPASENAYQVVIIDATESPIERPKKNKVLSESSWKGIEFWLENAKNKENHAFEILCVAVASGCSFDELDCTVDAFQQCIGQAGCHKRNNAIGMSAQRGDEFVSVEDSFFETITPIRKECRRRVHGGLLIEQGELLLPEVQQPMRRVLATMQFAESSVDQADNMKAIEGEYCRRKALTACADECWRHV